jgi:protein TonB
MKYALPAPVEAPWERPLRLAFILGLHGALFAAALAITLEPRMVQTLESMDLRVIEEPSSKKEPEKPVPPEPLPQISQPVIQMPDLPVFTSAAAESSYAVATQPEAPPAPPAPSAPVAAPQPVVAASFDADYLHNPAPLYPYASRRNHDEGKVILMVLVSAEGTTKSLKLHRSSGYRALDDAAIDAVRQWKFVPARRGAEAVEDWVLVPISFHLTHS